MGFPSIGIYSFELFTEYDVDHKAIVTYKMDYEKFIYRVFKYKFDGFYFEKSILDNLYKLNNETIKLITELESASFLLKGCWFGSGKIQPEEGEPNDQNILILKRIYLIEPTYLGIKYQLKRNNELKLMCEEFEKDRVLDPLTNYFNYLNKILEESYKS